MSWTNRAYPVGVASIALTLLLSACGGDEQGKKDEPDPTAPPSSAGTDPEATGSPSPGSSSTPSGPAPSGAPQRFDTEGQTTLPDTEVRDVALTSDAALVLNAERLTSRTVPGLVETYELRADTGFLVDLWVAPRGGDGVVVEAIAQPGEGTSIGVDTYAVKRFDVGSGEVADAASVQLRQDARATPGTASAKVAGVVGDIVVLDTWESTGSPDDAFAAASARHTTVAVDLGSGALAWSAPGTRPVHVSDDVAVVTTGTPSEDGQLRGLSLDAGARRWAALPGTRSVSVVGTDGDRLTLAAARGESGKGVVAWVDTGTGETGGSRPTPTWNWACHDTSTTIALCSLLGSNRVVGWDLRRHAPVWSLPSRDRFAPTITAVYDDAAYGLVGGGRGIVLDALTGEDLASDTGAAPTAVSAAGGLSLLSGEATFQPAAG